jgi:hypothetical protein
MLLFIPRSLCALKRVAAKAEHARFETRDWLKRRFVWDSDRSM